MPQFDNEKYRQAYSSASCGNKPDTRDLTVLEKYQIDTAYRAAKVKAAREEALRAKMYDRPWPTIEHNHPAGGAYAILGIAAIAGILTWFSIFKSPWSLPVSIPKQDYDAWQEAPAPSGFVNVARSIIFFESPKGKEIGQAYAYITQADMGKWLAKADLSAASRGKRKGRPVVYIAQFPKEWASRFRMRSTDLVEPLTAGWVYESALHQFYAVDSPRYKGYLKQYQDLQLR